MTYLTAIICSIIFMRLFTYQRGGARFRRGVSIAASVVMAACGTVIIYALTGKLRLDIYYWPIDVMLGLLMVALLQCGGNMAKVIIIPKPWDGDERRGSGKHV